MIHHAPTFLFYSGSGTRAVLHDAHTVLYVAVSPLFDMDVRARSIIFRCFFDLSYDAGFCFRLPSVSCHRTSRGVRFRSTPLLLEDTTIFSNDVTFHSALTSKLKLLVAQYSNMALSIRAAEQKNFSHLNLQIDQNDIVFIIENYIANVFIVAG